MCSYLSLPVFVCASLALNSVQKLDIATVPDRQADDGSDLLRTDSTGNVVCTSEEKRWIFVARKMTEWPQSAAHKRTMPTVAGVHFKANSQSCGATGWAFLHLCD